MYTENTLEHTELPADHEPAPSVPLGAEIQVEAVEAERETPSLTSDQLFDAIVAANGFMSEGVGSYFHSGNSLTKDRYEDQDFSAKVEQGRTAGMPVGSSIGTGLLDMAMGEIGRIKKLPAEQRADAFAASADTIDSVIQQAQHTTGQVTLSLAYDIAEFMYDNGRVQDALTLVKSKTVDAVALSSFDQEIRLERIRKFIEAGKWEMAEKFIVADDDIEGMDPVLYKVEEFVGSIKAQDFVGAARGGYRKRHEGDSSDDGDGPLVPDRPLPWPELLAAADTAGRLGEVLGAEEFRDLSRYVLPTYDYIKATDPDAASTFLMDALAVGTSLSERFATADIRNHAEAFVGAVQSEPEPLATIDRLLAGAAEGSAEAVRDAAVQMLMTIGRQQPEAVETFVVAHREALEGSPDYQLLELSVAATLARTNPEWHEHLVSKIGELESVGEIGSDYRSIFTELTPYLKGMPEVSQRLVRDYLVEVAPYDYLGTLPERSQLIALVDTYAGGDLQGNDRAKAVLSELFSLSVESQYYYDSEGLLYSYLKELALAQDVPASKQDSLSYISTHELDMDELMAVLGSIDAYRSPAGELTEAETKIYEDLVKTFADATSSNTSPYDFVTSANLYASIGRERLQELSGSGSVDMAPVLEVLKRGMVDNFSNMTAASKFEELKTILPYLHRGVTEPWLHEIGESIMDEEHVDDFVGELKADAVGVIGSLKHMSGLKAEAPAVFDLVNAQVIASLGGHSAEDNADYLYENAVSINTALGSETVLPWLKLALAEYSVAVKAKNDRTNSTGIFANGVMPAAALNELDEIIDEAVKSYVPGDDPFAGLTESSRPPTDIKKLGVVRADESRAFWRLLDGRGDAADFETLGVSAEVKERFENLATALDSWVDNQLLPRLQTEAPEAYAALAAHQAGLKQKIHMLYAQYAFAANKADTVIKLGYAEDVWGVHEEMNRLSEGMVSALKTDTKYYGHVFDEFDGRRKRGEQHTEVYLGRDGVYAYIARRAQDVGERRGMERDGRQILDPTERRQLKYLVYPRHFRDYASRQQKSRYLADQGVSMAGNPYFYDTGYTGTIPEDILEQIEPGLPEREVDRRIRLLSALDPVRRVSGMSANARAEIIESIEYNVKDQDTATGFYRDGAGRLQPYAETTSAKHQFSYKLLEYGLRAFYYEQGKKSGRDYELNKILDEQIEYERTLVTA